MNTLLRYVVLPSLVYLAGFLLLTFPAVIHFSSDVWTDTGDGLQNVWNLWWVHKAVIDLHQSPWHTNYLHYPYGVTLLGHTLNPLNGLLALPLWSFCRITLIYNIILLFSFVATGVAGAALIRNLIHHEPSAWFGGALITFSSFHFAHAQGHLQLVAMEGLPFFLWSWCRLLRAPKVLNGILAGVALDVIIGCDYYYFFYALVAGFILAVVRWIDSPSTISFPAVFKPFIGLVAATAGVVLPVVIGLLRLRAHGLSEGAHDPAIYSLDLQSLFIPGGHWHWNAWTQPFWSSWTGNPHETNVYLGWSVVALAALGATKMARTTRRAWTSLMVVFFILALGPYLHWAGHTFRFAPLPYVALEHLLPILKLSGCPVRMTVMVQLAVAVFAAFGFREIYLRSRGVSLVVVIVVTLDLLPKTLPMTRLDIPPVIRALKTASGNGGVIDALSSSTYALYYQTAYDKPMALGYVSRIPDDVYAEDLTVLQFYRRGEFGRLWKNYHLRYLILSSHQGWALQPPLGKILFVDDSAMLLDLSS